MKILEGFKLARRRDGLTQEDPYGMPLYEETPRIPPRGRKLGALRSSPRDGEMQYWSDAFPGELVDLEKWPGLINAEGGDHREHRVVILDQRNRGSCAAEGCCNISHTGRQRRGLDIVIFNPWILYRFSGGGSDNGSSLIANIREARRIGLVPDELWPRSQHDFRDIPPNGHEAWVAAKEYRPGEVYSVGNTVELGSALLRGHQMYGAWPGHAFEIIAIISTLQCLVNNSWGPDWGDNGIGVLNFSRVQYNYGLYAQQTTTSED